MRRLASLALAVPLALPALAEPADTVSDEAARGAVEELRKALKEGDDRAKLAAIAACGTAPHSITAAALAPLLLVNGPEEVRVEAAEALGRMTGLPEAAKALHAAVKPNEEREKTLAEIFKAMGSVGLKSSIQVCVDFIEPRVAKRSEKEVSEIKYATACLAVLRFKASVAALIELMKRNETNNRWGGAGIVRNEVWFQLALVKLTGEKLEGGGKAWDDWWEKHEGDFTDDMTRRKK
jgi:HEAT repeat protein